MFLKLSKYSDLFSGNLSARVNHGDISPLGLFIVGWKPVGNLAGDSRISVLSQVLKPSTKTFLDFLKVLANPVVLSYKPLPYKKKRVCEFSNLLCRWNQLPEDGRDNCRSRVNEPKGKDFQTCLEKYLGPKIAKYQGFRPKTLTPAINLLTDFCVSRPF